MPTMPWLHGQPDLAAVPRSSSPAGRARRNPDPLPAAYPGLPTRGRRGFLQYRLAGRLAVGAGAPCTGRSAPLKAWGGGATAIAVYYCVARPKEPPPSGIAVFPSHRHAGLVPALVRQIIPASAACCQTEGEQRSGEINPPSEQPRRPPARAGLSRCINLGPGDAASNPKRRLVGKAMEGLALGVTRGAHGRAIRRSAD